MTVESYIAGVVTYNAIIITAILIVLATKINRRPKMWSDNAIEAALDAHWANRGNGTDKMRAALNAAAAVDGKRARSSYADDAAYNQLLKGEVCPEDQPFVADWIKRLSEQTDGDVQWNAAIEAAAPKGSPLPQHVSPAQPPRISNEAVKAALARYINGLHDNEGMFSTTHAAILAALEVEQKK